MVTALTGEQIEEIKQQAAEHFWPHSVQAGDMSENGVQIVNSGKGVWVEDAVGDKWFDLISSMYLVNIGHGRPEIAEAVYEQMKAISYSPGATVTPATSQLSAKVASLSPDKDSQRNTVGAQPGT